MSQLSAWGNAQQWGRPVRGLLAVLLLILLAFVLAQTVWLLWSGPSDAIPADSKLRLQAGNSSSSATLSQAQVESWELFGPFRAAAVERQAEQPTDAPETRLRLELLGVFQTADPDKATAIIAEKGKDGELYHVGDSIPGNAKLEEVYPDRVILRRAGRLETLRWSETALGGVNQVSAPVARSFSSSSRPAPPPSESEAGGDQNLLQQRQQIIGQLGLSPVSAGQDAGYRLGDKAPQGLISQVGLRSDDVILSVNGYPLGTPEGDLEAMRSYQDTQQASIVVQRGDQQFTVNYPP